MNERIKYLRKEVLDMTQDDFSSAVGLSRNFIAQIETGAKIPSDRTVKDICRVYNVNEEWLRYGTGEMLKAKSVKEELVELTDKLLSEESTSFKNRLVSALARLTDEQWDVLEKVIDEISKKE